MEEETREDVSEALANKQHILDHSEALEVAGGLFASNVELLTNILNLKKQNANCLKKMEEEKALFEAHMDSLASVISSQQEQLEEVQKSQSLRALWSRLLTSTSSSSTKKVGGGGGGEREVGSLASNRGAALAMTLLSSQIAHDASVQLLEKRVEGELQVLQNENDTLRASLSREKITTRLLTAEKERTREDCASSRATPTILQYHDALALLNEQQQTPLQLSRFLVSPSPPKTTTILASDTR